MPLDEYKTQVLIMHSEQSTLDNLSSGFNDRYTVHCATSGSEALNTLVETPINIIVTAQDLPGMSGLDALREAKKRSPDTIGILLAGNQDEGLEALVGEEEVFQVIRGNITSDGLKKLVDNATQQLRLVALAESANDMAANPDELEEQHIVMETSENGSTIISDGTGRLRSLDPTKVSAAANLGARAVDLLVLTKDQDFLETIKESSRGMHEVHYANTLAQADEAIRKHAIGVAVIDAAMVGDKVEQLTLHLRKGVQRLVSIVAGRRDDGEMLMDLINRGKVYRFLMKPVSPGRARLAVEASVKYHLEAPDAAFANKGAAATAPKATAPQAQAKKKAASKPAAPSAPEKQAKKSPAENRVEKSQATDPPLGDVNDPTSNSPIDQGLGDAFGEDEGSFAETVTGLISSVSSRFSGGDSEKSSAAPDPDPQPIATNPASLDAESISGSGGSIMQSPKFLGLLAVAVVIGGGSLYWLMRDSGPTEQVVESLPAPAISEADVAFTEEPAPVAATVDADALLDEARLAHEAGQLFNPVGGNAIELYVAAINAEPDNQAAIAELESVLGEALGMAETAMLESRLDDADAAISRVAEARPDHDRLPFLTAQLSQMQIGGYLSEARSAVREKRFEDAAAAIAAARGLNPTNTSDVDAAEAELLAARSDQQVDEVLARAINKLDEGDLLAPANDNARYYYSLVLSNDPNNSAAIQGMNIIASRVAEQAESAINRGDFSRAENLLDEARTIDAGNSDVAAATSALGNARLAAAERQRQADADRLAAEQAAEEAERAQAAAAEQQRLAALADAESATAADATLAENDGAVGTDVDGPANIDEPTAKTAAATSKTGAGAAGSGEPATQDAPSLPPITAISSLNRTKYVAPKYPRGAQRRNVSGWVDVVFTVSIDGTVKDATVRNSDPGDTFVASALSAVSRWEFDPVFEDGQAVEKRAGVRMMFALEE